MTTKEIAELSNVDKRTINRWIIDAIDKMSSIKDKMSTSSPTSIH